jgi:photosystem II stability/assembly factor-like uncharacterized protein
MKKNILHTSRGLLLLYVLTTAAYPQWIQTNWPASSSFFNLYTSRNEVIARTWDSLNGGRTFLTSDGGTHWTQIGSADSSIDILSIVLLNNTLLAGTWNGFYTSTSGGSSWKAVTPVGITADTAIQSISFIAATLFAGTRGGLYKSSDSGATWSAINSGIPLNARITSIVSSNNAIAAGSDSSGVFISTNNGTSWSAVNSGLTDKHIFQLAAIGSKLFAVTLNGVFIYGNNTWAANSSIPMNSNCFTVAKSQLFVGTDSGAFRSSDSGVTWTSFSQGLPANTRVWSLAVTGDTVFAGTSSGVWLCPLSLSTVKKPGRVSMTAPFTGLRFRRQNNHTATIAFTLSCPQTIDLDVHDLCGGKIVSLAHKKFGAGFQCISFDAGSIVPGPYIIRLVTGRNVYQQTIQLLR